MAYDLIVIGGGHNGLTTAALQGKRGRKVLVLEQRDALGGLAAGEEFHPGYKSTGVLHDTSAVRSSVVEALGLTGYGLQLRDAAPDVLAPQVDGRGLVLSADDAKTVREIGEHANLDGDRYTDFVAFCRKVQGYLRAILAEPAPRIAPKGLGQYVELFKKGLALRKLGRATMYECMRVGPMSVEDWLDEYFECDLLKAALCAPGLLGTWTSPRAAGTAALTLIERCTAEAGVVGGPAALVEALAGSCRAKGVELRTGAEVQRLVIERSRVTGVELADGTRESAKHVASSVDPRRTFLDLVRPMDLPAELEAIHSWRVRGTTAKLDLALNGPLEFACRPDETFEAIRVAESMTEIERAFDPVKYRALPSRPHLDIRVPSVSAKGLAPDGHHVASILVHFVPYELDEGWDDRSRAALLETTLDRLAEVAPTVRDRIVGHRLRTPVDLEADLGLSGGHVHHGEHGLDQMLSLRPHQDCARHATPIEGLYLCGSGSHPGGGITCAPGELADAAMA